MKYCTKCGNELRNKDLYCSKCGTKVEKEIKEAKEVKDTSSDEVGGNFTINKRDIATQIILTVITCGLYGLYWIATITDDVNMLNEDNNNTSGITVVLLSILTCGLYLIYWNYDTGRKLYELGKKYDKEIADNSIVYLILSIFKADLVNLILMQSDLNKLGK